MKILLTLSLLCFGFSLFAQPQEFPMVEEYGAIFLVPEASQTPDSSLVYKIIIDIPKSPKGGKDINFSLDRVARTLNLHRAGGVTEENLEVRVIGYAAGVHAFLSDEAHEDKYGKPNPNTALLDKLDALNITLMVCGQSIRYADIDATELNSNVQVATSYITAMTTAQLEGFVTLHF